MAGAVIWGRIEPGLSTAAESAAPILYGGHKGLGAVFPMLGLLRRHVRWCRQGPMSDDLGFAYTERKSGEIVITRSGKTVTVLRGAAAKKFKDSLERLEPQEAMARITGNYKHGNEPGRNVRGLRN